MKAKIERLGEIRPMQNMTESCAHCNEENKSRRRDFSEQAWAALVVWSEVQKTEVDQAICDDCYSELREVLIDRAEEIETAAKTKDTKDLPAAKKAIKAATPVAAAAPRSVPGSKVRKAS